VKIGMSWWHGGAQAFADQMKYTNPEMRYGDGDFKAFDTSVNMFLLGLYETQARVYLNKEVSNMKLFDVLLNIATNNICAKITHIIGRTWRMIFGVMPSGAFETSHGNSWILGLLWFSFFEYVCMMYPHRAVQLNKLFDDGLIEFPDYGDDHVPAVHSSVHDILCEAEFGKFVQKYFDMEIRNLRNSIPFLSVPDAFGGLKKEGVTFLKTFFILRPEYMPKHLPDVVPFRKISDCLVKLGWGNSPRLSLADYCVATIGLVYDSKGTNLPFYEICRQIFDYTFQVAGFTDMRDVRKAFFAFGTDGARKDLTKILRKCHITVDEIFKGFPRIEELWEMHTYDAAYVNFTPQFGHYSSGERKYDDRSDYYTDE